jgi:hypothetical protein
LRPFLATYGHLERFGHGLAIADPVCGHTSAGEQNGHRQSFDDPLDGLLRDHPAQVPGKVLVMLRLRLLTEDVLDVTKL